MRKFIAFFKRFQVFLVFIILQIIALTSYFSIMSYPRTTFFNSSQTIVGKLFEWEREFTKHLYLDEANQKLIEENVELARKIPRNFVSIDSSTARIEDKVYELFYEYIPATVINSSHNFSNNYFTIDGGKRRGIEKKMGVISSEGVVGIVYDVSEHYALVKSILTEDFNISALVEKSEAFGIIKYDGENPLNVQLSGVSNDIEIDKGLKIVTRGSGGIFPQGIPIGSIVDFEAVEGKPMWNIEVGLNQDMRKLRYVYVIKNKHQLELKELERRLQE